MKTFGGLNVLLVVLIILLLSGSCRRVVEIDGKYEIISRTIDNSLGDSVQLYGKVVGITDTLSPRINARIWTNEPTRDTYADNAGLYSIMLPSGTYTVNCKEASGTDRFKETIEGMSFLPNEKVKIYFYLGTTIE